jgi:aldehyde:ferredoxin oxidoreductase
VRGTGSIRIAEDEWKKDHGLTYWKIGRPKHHSSEDPGQCGVIINTQYNRDAQCHSHAKGSRPVQEKQVAHLNL